VVEIVDDEENEHDGKEGMLALWMTCLFWVSN
jgi:hypothetical protein